MGHSANFARLAAASAVAACLVFVGPSAFAQTAGAKAADASEASRKSLEAGAKSLAAGKYQPAVDQLSTALRNGLAGPEMAKALYLRGLAYKKQNKPGLAISDLTSALWLKNGLNAEDRKHATAERAEAYTMAGLGDGTSGGSERIAVADPNKTAPEPAAPSPAPAAAQAAAVAPPADTSQVTRQAPESAAAQEAANARRIAAMPIDAGGMQAAATATLVSRGESSAATPPTSTAASPLQIAAAEPATAPTLSALPTDESGTSSPSASPMSSIGGFFSNIFGGASSQSQADGQSVTTASTSSHDPQISSWSNATSVAEPGKPAKAAMKEAPPAAKKSAKKGKFKLHIAAVRSRADADALAQKLTTQHAAELGDHLPTVDEAVIGSMGTFYRVRVGGYASQEEPRGLCNKLRTSGFDCLVVTN